MSPRHENNIHIVIETLNGSKSETRLPKEQAQRLFRKIRSVGGDATIKREEFKPVEQFQRPISEMW